MLKRLGMGAYFFLGTKDSLAEKRQAANFVNSIGKGAKIGFIFMHKGPNISYLIPALVAECQSERRIGKSRSYRA